MSESETASKARPASSGRRSVAAAGILLPTLFVKLTAACSMRSPEAQHARSTQPAAHILDLLATEARGRLFRLEGVTDAILKLEQVGADGAARRRRLVPSRESRKSG